MQTIGPFDLQVGGPPVQVTVDDRLVAIYVSDGFAGGSLQVTCKGPDGQEYPRAATFAFTQDGPNGPYVLDLDAYGFAPWLVLRAVPGTSSKPPASVRAHGVELRQGRQRE